MILYFLCLFYNNIDCLNANYLSPSKTHKLQVFETKSRELELAIFNQCFNDDTEAIIIFGNWSYNVHHFVFQMSPKPIILLSKDKSDTLERYEIWKRSYLIDVDEIPINKFIIHEFDVSSIQLVLYKLKNSKWWNIDAFFFINNGLTFNSCKSAYLILDITWKFNILNAIYLCHSSKDGIGLYTFNPYSAHAPQFWTVSRNVQESKYLFTLFIHHYQLTEHILSLDCKALKFDKIQHLANYTVKVAVSSLKVPIIYFRGIVLKKDTFEITTKIAKLILETIGCNVSFVYYNFQHHGTIDINGTATGISRDVLRGKYDFNSVDDYQFGLGKYEIIYWRQSKVCFLIKREKITLFEQLSKVLSAQGFIVFLLFFGILTVLFTFILKISYLEVMVDVLRSAAGLPMIHFPTTIFKRIIFISLIFAIIIVNTYRQCQWSAALTTGTFRQKNINNVYDLIKYQFKVYTAKYYEQYYKHTTLKINAIKQYADCVRLVNDNDNAACVKDCFWFKTLIPYENPKFQYIEDEFFDRYNVFLTRDDFPLRRKVELISLKLREHGLIHYIEITEKSHFNVPYKNRYKPISIDKFNYSFYYLIIFQIFNIFIFLCEILKQLMICDVVRKKLYFKNNC